MTHLIAIEGVTFKYPDHSASDRDTLHDINLTMETGEYIAILGANGSGKSTLARMVNALILPDSGSVRVNGFDTRNREHLAEIRKTVGMVFQFPEEQIFSSTIEEDVAFGLENFGWSYESMHRQVQETLEKLGLWEIRQRPSYLLSSGQTQRLALAGVLALKPKCVIFDEATSMLDPLGRETVLQQMTRLHEGGNTVIHITHSMEEAAQSSRVIVLLEGSVVYDGSPADLFSGKYDLAHWRLEYPLELQLIQSLKEAGVHLPDGAVTLDQIADYLTQNRQPAQYPSGPDSFSPAQDLEIEVHQLGHIYLEGTPYQTRALRSTDVSVEKGTCHGLIGVTGSGKSTLLQHLNGLLRPQIGTVRVGPYFTADKKFSLQQLVQYAGLVMQNPEVQFFQEFVGDEIAYGPRTVKINEPIAQRVRWAMDQVNLTFDHFKDRRIHSLSGGEKRKVALASILALQPSIFLLDEPTAGLDPSTHQEILAVFKRMVADGTTIVLSSHNMEDMAVLTKRITVMVDGQSTAEGPSQNILGDAAGMRDLKMLAPISARLVEALRSRGVQMDASIASLAQLAEAVGGRHE
jgi:energy-coupling factor transport system ATP-binding protein